MSGKRTVIEILYVRSGHVTVYVVGEPTLSMDAPTAAEALILLVSTNEGFFGRSAARGNLPHPTKEELLDMPTMAFFIRERFLGAVIFVRVSRVLYAFKDVLLRDFLSRPNLRSELMETPGIRTKSVGAIFQVITTAGLEFADWT